MIIATDPARYVGVMPAAVIEKLSFAIAVYALFANQRVDPSMAVAATIDLLLGIAFIVAYHKTSASESSAPVFARRGVTIAGIPAKLLILNGR